ncbi:hypothetical protein J6590_072295 [Homalodisca vitripennis]|nr:hypothetical protein J6590_072295 [Homalodisca vitripennis]
MSSSLLLSVCIPGTSAKEAVNMKHGMRSEEGSVTTAVSRCSFRIRYSMNRLR